MHPGVLAFYCYKLGWRFPFEHNLERMPAAHYVAFRYCLRRDLEMNFESAQLRRQQQDIERRRREMEEQMGYH